MLRRRGDKQPQPLASGWAANNGEVRAAPIRNQREIQRAQLLEGRPARAAADDVQQRELIETLRLLREEANEARRFREAQAYHIAEAAEAAEAAARNTMRGLLGVGRNVRNVGQEAARGTAAAVAAAAEAREAGHIAQEGLRVGVEGLDVGREGLAVGRETQSKVSMVQATTNLLVRKSNQIIAQGTQILAVTTQTQSMVGKLSVMAAYQQGNRVGFIGAWVQNEWLMCATFLLLTPVFPVTIQSIQGWYALTMGTAKVAHRIYEVTKSRISFSIGGAIYTVSPILLMTVLWRVNGQLIELREANDPAYAQAFRGNLESTLPSVISAGRDFIKNLPKLRVSNSLGAITPEMRQNALNVLSDFFRYIYNGDIFADLGPILYKFISNPTHLAKWFFDFMTGNASVIINGVSYVVKSTLGKFYFDALIYTLGTWNLQAGALSADIVAWIISYLWAALEGVVKMIYNSITGFLASTACSLLIRITNPITRTPAMYSSYDTCIESFLGKQKTAGGSRRNRRVKRKTRRFIKQRGGAEGELQVDMKREFINVFFELTMLELIRALSPNRLPEIDKVINALYNSQAVVYELTLQDSLGFENPIPPIVNDENTAIVPYKSILKNV